MIRAILAVSIGGALGSVLRYQAGVFSAKHFQTNFPLSTLLINISGCFLVGIFFALNVRSHLDRRLSLRGATIAEM